MTKKFKLILGAVLATLALLFVLQNADVVRVRFLFWSLTMSQAVVILLSLGAGVIGGWILSTLFRVTRKSTS